MISVTVWDCTGSNTSAKYNFLVDNNLNVAALREKIAERAYTLKRNFLLYYGNNVVRDLDMELISFISGTNKIGDISLTFTIYDENFVIYTVRVTRGIKIGNIKYVPLIMRLFSKTLEIELLDQETVRTLKREIIKQLRNIHKISNNLVPEALLVSYEGELLENDTTLINVQGPMDCLHLIA